MANSTTKRNWNVDQAALETLRQDSMMAYLLDSLEDGQDIGHYGRFVFASVARHFLSEGELISVLTHDRDFDEASARRMVEDIAERGYNPPRRETILDFQTRQDFPIIPHEEDPDFGNVYRDLSFPDEVYEHIAEYREAKEHATA